VFPDGTSAVYCTSRGLNFVESRDVIYRFENPQKIQRLSCHVI
jgi:hypothetical protein